MKIATAKRMIAVLLSCALLLLFVSCTIENTDTDETLATAKQSETKRDTEGVTEDAKKPSGNTSNEKEKIMDIYIIAGQSNAVGHSHISNAQELYAQTENKLRLGYSNVHYSGNARSNNNLNNIRDWDRVTLGLGFTPQYFGPEVGMADAFSSYYNGSTGKHAGIIKMAHGGTSLLNKTTDVSNIHGNWVSPSYAAELGIPFEGATGGIYRALLDQIRTGLADLENYGFTDVNVKAMYWMQGETDRDQPEEYKKSFEYFVEDLRRDLSDVLKEYTGTNDDRGASEMPIFVGTICETFFLQSTNGDTTLNRAFIEMQKTLPTVVDNCYVVDVSQYKMNEVVNGSVVMVDQVSGGGHWNQQNAFAVGRDVAAAMLDKCVEIER